MYARVDCCAKKKRKDDFTSILPFCGRYIGSGILNPHIYVIYIHPRTVLRCIQKILNRLWRERKYLNWCLWHNLCFTLKSWKLFTIYVEFIIMIFFIELFRQFYLHILDYDIRTRRKKWVENFFWDLKKFKEVQACNFELSIFRIFQVLLKSMKQHENRFS